MQIEHTLQEGPADQKQVVELEVNGQSVTMDYDQCMKTLEIILNKMRATFGMHAERRVG